MTKTYICDVMPGGGKSSAVIKMMNEQVNRRFIYIAPYLEECDRIIKACESRGFVAPMPKSEGGKLENLHTLLRQGANISSTHALFAMYTEETVELINDGDYCLVMDEAFKIAEMLAYTKYDIEMLLGAGFVDTTGNKVVWTGADEYDGKFLDLKRYAESGHLQSFRNLFFYWYYPPEVFGAFREAYVLTYMFDSQFLRYYFDINDIEYTNIWVDMVDGEYMFVDYPVVPSHAKSLRDKIHILDHPRMNSIGDNRFALSSRWFENAVEKRPGVLKQLRNNLKNYFHNIMKKSANEVIWTTYQSGQDSVGTRGYTSDFVSFNARATNKYKDRDTLAYCVNVFPNPNYVAFFNSHGCKVDGNGYALAEMIQLIWRSAIREGKDIWVYIPSKRMRTLLEGWLDELATE